MKKLMLSIPAALSLGLAALLTGPGASSVPAQQIEVRAPAETPAPQQNRDTRSHAIREVRRLGDATRMFKIPAAHKNRGPGERAHRTWRRRRASGRR